MLYFYENNTLSIKTTCFFRIVRPIFYKKAASCVPIWELNTTLRLFLCESCFVNVFSANYIRFLC